MDADALGAPRNEHFMTVESWRSAAAALAFAPNRPQHTLGRELRSLSIHVRDHRRRELEIDQRTLEAHYGDFVVAQRLVVDAADAHTFVVETQYGLDPQVTQIGEAEGRAYELGPPVDVDDPDGRSSSVVVWSDRRIGYFIASAELQVADLLVVARSIRQAPIV